MFQNKTLTLRNTRVESCRPYFGLLGKESRAKGETDTGFRFMRDGSGWDVEVSVLS